jgi:hypothetical protein
MRQGLQGAFGIRREAQTTQLRSIDHVAPDEHFVHVPTRVVKLHPTTAVA